eukprot:5286-Ditylum_brightwellii.AAC.1
MQFGGGRWRGDCGRGDGAKKVKTWDPTRGANYCPLKPRQCFNRAVAFPSAQKEDNMCVITLGDRACDDTAVFVAIVITIVSRK